MRDIPSTVNTLLLKVAFYIKVIARRESEWVFAIIRKGVCL